jgi:hypothetical protein
MFFLPGITEAYIGPHRCPHAINKNQAGLFTTENMPGGKAFEARQQGTNGMKTLQHTSVICDMYDGGSRSG